jgi:hypothetical protein
MDRSLRNPLSAVCAALLLGPAAAYPGSETLGEFTAGDAFPLREHHDSPQLNRIVFEVSQCGPMLRSRWHDPLGRLLAAEELEVGEEGFRRYRYWRPNIAESAVVTRNGSTLSIELQQSGRTQQREITISGDIAAGPLFLLAQDHLPELREGRKVPMRYLVPERFATYTVNFSEAASAGSERFGVSATMAGLARRTKPVTVYFDTEGRFQGLRGSTLPVAGTPDNKQPLELDVVVSRHFSRPCSPQPVSDPREMID